MSTELLVPFALDSNGNLAVTQDPNVQAEQHVMAIVATNPGERVMMPDYGIPVRGYLFSSNPQIVQMKINQNITQQMAIWEPAITVLGVTAGPADDFGVAQVSVDYSANPLQTSRSKTQTATVLVGGDVIEDNQFAVTLPSGASYTITEITQSES